MVVLWWLPGELLALAKGGYLVAVAAGGHAAPAAMVRARSVVEPEDAFGVFAMANQIEVVGGEEFGGGFCDWSENLFWGALLPFAFELQGSAFARRKSEMALRFGEKGVEVSYVGALARLSSFDEFADCLT